MSSPIIVNGSTTVISVRASNFTYNNGTVAVVLLSSINSFGRMVTIFDEDGYVGTAGRQIVVSTTRNVSFDSGQPVGGGAGDFRYFLTQKNQSLSVFPRTLNQWVLPQSVITSQLANPNSGITINATDFNALNAQVVSVSTNLQVFGSTVSGIPFTITGRVFTSYTQDALVVNGMQALTTSTGSVTVGAIVVANIGAGQLLADNISNTDFIRSSSFSTFVQRTSSLATRVITISDNSTTIPSVLSMSSLNTLWNGSNVPYWTASTFSAGLFYYSTSLPVLGINSGLSSISSFVPNAVSSLIGGDTLSSYSTAYITLVQSLNYGPGVSSLSTVINAGLSSVAIAPSLSTLSTVISRGLSSVIVAPGISSLNVLFGFSLSSVATNFGVSTLSTSISLGLSTVNATIAFGNVSTAYSRGVSDIANYTGISSLSTLVPGFFSSLILQAGVSSLSSYIFSTLSSVVVGPGISSLSTTTGNYYLTLQSPQGLSSLSTTISGLSTQSVTLGLSSLSSAVSLGLSSVSVFGGLSTISTTVAQGLVVVPGGSGLSTLSTVINSVASSLNTSQGASSLFLFIQNQFSSLNDQQGTSSLSSFIGPALSSIVTGGGGSVQTPANLSTLIINTSTFKLWDSTNSVYRTMNISASKFYIDTTPIDTFVVQSTSRSTISISSFNLSIPGQMNASTVFGTSLYINPITDFGISTFASTVSTGLFTTSSFITSSINFAIGGRSLNLYFSNNGLYFNSSTITLFSSLGTSSFSTSMSALSSLSNIMPMPFSNISTALSLGASTINVGQGVSTLSTLFTQVSSVFLFPGVSTKTFTASTALVSTISSYGQISTYIILGQLNTSTLITSSVYASNANIGVLNLPNILVSSFNFVNNNSANNLSTLSTLVTGAGVSTGNVTIFSQTASTFASNVITSNTYASSIILSTLFIPNFGGLPNPAPLIVSTGSIWFNGASLTNSGDPNNLTSLMYSFSTASVYASTVIISSLQTPTIVNVSQRMSVFENVEIIQSSLNLYNRTVFSTFNQYPIVQNDLGYYSLSKYISSTVLPNKFVLVSSFFTFDDPLNPTYDANGIYNSITSVWPSTTGFPTIGGVSTIVSFYSTTNSFELSTINYIPSTVYTSTVVAQYFDSIEYSTDGLNWRSTNWFQSSIANGINSIFSKPSYNGVYWLVGNSINTNPNGTQGYVMSNYNNSVMYSPNGYQYYGLENGQFDVAALQPRWNGQYWLAGDVYVTTVQRTIKRSVDGLVWTAANSGGFYGSCQNFGWNGSLWVAVGLGAGLSASNSNIQYSTDGLNWSNARGTLPESQANCVLFDGKKWIVGGQYFLSFVYSYDGINWTNGPVSDSNIVYDLAYNGKVYVAAGSLSNGNCGLAYSYDGINWTYANAFLPSPYNSDFPLNGSAYSVTWSGDRFVATGSNLFTGLSGVYSLDGLRWIPTDTTGQYRYIRFTAIKNVGGLTGSGQDIAMSRFNLTLSGARVYFNSSATIRAVTYNTTTTVGDGGVANGINNLLLQTNPGSGKYDGFLPGISGLQPVTNFIIPYESFIVDNTVPLLFDGYNWASGDYAPRIPIRWKIEGSIDLANWNVLSDKTAADVTVPQTTWAYQGPWTLDVVPDFTSIDMGQGIGFASNILPALETTTLRIHTMGKGYIPLYLTSTNHWQVTPSSIIMNNNFTINKELGSDKRIGIGTPYPLATLDIAGTMQANNSTFFSSIVIGSSFGYNGSTQTNGYVPTFDVSVIGSSFMTNLVINTPQNISRKGPLDVTSPNQPIINRGAYVNISSFGRSLAITSTLVNINQVATFPQSGRPTSQSDNPVDNAFVYWLWNNGPASQQSSLYFAISGTASFFTGQHACFVSSVTQENVSSYVGLITASDDQGYVSVSLNGDIVTGSNAIYSTESLPKVALTTTDMQKGVFGVISDQQNLPAAVNFSTMYSAYDIQTGFKNALYGRLLINAVGDGALWTTNVNGNVSIGDYLCSSVIPGHARVQDDPTAMYNYTVAKATMNCDFDLNSSNYRCETIDYDGSTFTRAFIGVSYHCG